jgi:homoserine O-acetyltransferase
VRRMDALTYVRLTECMDTHDVCRGRSVPHSACTAKQDQHGDAPAPAGGSSSGSDCSVTRVLSAVRCPVLVLGLDSDALYPLRQVRELSRNIPHAQWRVIRTEHGHDGFLLEQDQVNDTLCTFLDTVL